MLNSRYWKEISVYHPTETYWMKFCISWGTKLHPLPCLINLLCLFVNLNDCSKPPFLHMIHILFVHLSKNWCVTLETPPCKVQKPHNNSIIGLMLRLSPNWSVVLEPIISHAALYHWDSIDSVDRWYLAADHQRITDLIWRQSGVAQVSRSTEIRNSHISCWIIIIPRTTDLLLKYWSYLFLAFSAVCLRKCYGLD